VTEVSKDESAATHRTIYTTVAFINQRLGVTIPSAEIIDLCARCGFTAVLKEGQGVDALTLSVPGGRADIQSENDIVEEIGRLYGYEKIPATMPAPLKRAQEQNPTIIVAEAFRALLHSYGFSEVYTPTLVAGGSIRIANPLASDKCALRVSLAENIERALELNVKNAPLFNASRIHIFEIGTAFPALSAEEFHVCIGVRNAKKTKEKEDVIVVDILKRIAEVAGNESFTALVRGVKPQNGIAEFYLSKELIADLAQGIEERVAKAGIAFPALPAARFVRYSVYPFIVRDIALFVRGGADTQPVQECITTAAREGVARIGARLERIDLFDIFTKKDEAGNERTSYGFRLVIISDSKTLSDEEANGVMERVYAAVRSRGWEVR
jgi:phenylalanyl-tRNA synthetase beta chain